MWAIIPAYIKAVVKKKFKQVNNIEAQANTNTKN
jgi:hypothetical protein